MISTRNINFPLKRRGRLSTLEVSTGTTYNPATGVNESTSDEYEVKAYFAQYNLGEENSSVALGSRVVAISTTDINGAPIPIPDTEDKITGVEDTVVITGVQTIYSGETPVCYVCQVSE